MRFLAAALLPGRPSCRHSLCEPVPTCRSGAPGVLERLRRSQELQVRRGLHRLMAMAMLP